MAKLPQLQNFRSQFLAQLNVVLKLPEVKLGTARSCNKGKFDRAMQLTLQLYLLRRVFVDRMLGQMTGSSRMANVPLP